MSFLDSRNSGHGHVWNQLGHQAYVDILHPLHIYIATELWDSIGDRMAYQLLLDQLEEDHGRC